MATIKDTVGDEFYEQLRRFLSWAFPDAPPPDDATVDGAIRALYRNHASALTERGLPPLPPDLLRSDDVETSTSADAPPLPLYVAQATHHRVRSMTSTDLGTNSGVPFQSEFVGYLPVVRVQLPQSFPSGTNPNIRTPIGNVYLGTDHIVGSIDLIVQKYGAQLGYTPGRVDLVTPARTGLTRSRFAAIAVYLGYKDATDPGPSFYILEAGMATGQPMMVYFGATIDCTIVAQSGYHPTAYSSPDNTYTGTLQVSGSDPTQLTVQANPPGAPYYIQVSVDYESTTSTSNDPFELLVMAAMRIALIGVKMGAPSGIPLQDLFAALALTLPWVIKPAYGGSGVTAESAAPKRAVPQEAS